MRSAPAVQFPVGRSSWGATLSFLPAVLGLLMGLLGWAGGLQPAQAGAVMVLACAISLAAWRWGGWRRQGCLAWNGREWLWENTATVIPITRLEVRLDGQRFLLLEVQTLAGARLWLWPERRMSPVLWHGLRQAVFLPGALESTAQEPV